LREIGQRVDGIRYTAVSMGIRRLEAVAKEEKWIAKDLEEFKRICEM
jgi:hypothetical protein